MKKRKLGIGHRLLRIEREQSGYHYFDPAFSPESAFDNERREIKFTRPVFHNGLLSKPTPQITFIGIRYRPHSEFFGSGSRFRS